jgi:ankyrin repeat protein
MAIESRDDSAVRLLLRHGADTRPKYQGMTAEQWAKQKGRNRIAAVLRASASR